MRKAISLLLGVMLLTSFATIQATYAQQLPPTDEEQKKAFEEITKAIDRAVEGNWSNIDQFELSQFDNNDTEVIKNDTTPIPEPPQCPADTHLDNGVCQPNEVPDNQTDTGNDTDTGSNVSRSVEVVVVGDADGKRVFNAIEAENADYCFFLGDLEYSDFEAFEDYLTICDTVKWVVGNHDDDSKFMQMETWNIKIGKSLWIGFSTEGNYDKQKATVLGYFNNATLMQDVKAIHLLSHKPTEQPHPNSHHGLEKGAEDFGNFVENLTPQGVVLTKEWGHNHDYAQNGDGTLKEIGIGGREHYTCGTNTAWPVCINDEFGYYKYKIDLDTGETQGNLYGTNGEVLH